MKTRNWMMVDGAGKKVIRGKAEVPDFVTVRIPIEKCVHLAEMLLRTHNAPGPRLATMDLMFAGKLHETD